MAENMKFWGPYANIRLGPGEKKKEAGSSLTVTLAAGCIGNRGRTIPTYTNKPVRRSRLVRVGNVRCGGGAFLWGE